MNRTIDLNPLAFGPLPRPRQTRQLRCSSLLGLDACRQRADLTVTHQVRLPVLGGPFQQLIGFSRQLTRVVAGIDRLEVPFVELIGNLRELLSSGVFSIDRPPRVDLAQPRIPASDDRCRLVEHQPIMLDHCRIDLRRRPDTNDVTSLVHDVDDVFHHVVDGDVRVRGDQHRATVGQRISDRLDDHGGLPVPGGPQTRDPPSDVIAANAWD